MPYFYLALAMALVGANIAVGKAVVAIVPVFLFATLRFLIASHLEVALLAIALSVAGIAVPNLESSESTPAQRPVAAT